MDTTCLKCGEDDLPGDYYTTVIVREKREEEIVGPPAGYRKVKTTWFNPIEMQNFICSKCAKNLAFRGQILNIVLLSVLPIGIISLLILLNFKDSDLFLLLLVIGVIIVGIILALVGLSAMKNRGEEKERVEDGITYFLTGKLPIGCTSFSPAEWKEKITRKQVN